MACDPDTADWVARVAWSAVEDLLEGDHVIVVMDPTAPPGTPPCSVVGPVRGIIHALVEADKLAVELNASEPAGEEFIVIPVPILPA